MFRGKERSYFVSFILFFAFFPLGGCAGYGLYAAVAAAPQDVPASLVREEVSYSPEHPVNQRPLLVVIRYPSRIEDRAKVMLAKAIDEKYIDLPMAPVGRGRVDLISNKDPEEQLLVRSAYFVTEFYLQLAKRLPQGTVILQAESVDLNDTGNLYMQSVNALPPALIYVDFFVYFAPLRSYIGLPESAGKYVTPVISVYTSFKGSPETFGAIAGVKAVPLAIGGADPSTGVSNGLRGNLLTFFSDLPKHDGENTPEPKKMNSQPPYKSGDYFEFPLVEFEMSLEAIEAQAKRPGGFYTDPPSRRIFGAYSDIIVEALNELDHASAVEVDRRRYVQIYDPALSEKYTRADFSKNEMRRLKYIERFEAEEHRFLAINDQEFIANTYQSDFGDQVRVMMVAEEKLRKATNQADAAMIFSGLMAAAVGTQTGYLDMSYIQIHEQTLENLSQSFDRNFRKLNQQAFEYVVQVGDESITIQANGLSELREKTAEIYAKKIVPKYPSHELAS